jgi:hypothetical protein
MFWHIVEREFYHFWMAAGFYLASHFGLAFLNRKWPDWTRRINTALVALFFIFLREPLDVANGGWLGKSYIDLAFWGLGFAACIWGIKRLNGTKW